jgi:hypothetical protein
VDRDIRAFIAGVAVFVALYALYWCALAVGGNELQVGIAIIGFGYAVPLIAGGVTAYLSGGYQFAAVLGLGFAGAGLVATINFVASSFGFSSDFPAAASIPIVAILSLLVQVPLVLIGGAVVRLWLRWRHA